MLQTLGKSLHDKYEHESDMRALRNSAKCYTELTLHPLENYIPAHAGEFYYESAIFLMEFSEISGKLPPLNRAIDASRKAAAIASDEPPANTRQASLLTLGTGLQIRYDKMGRREDLDEAMKCQAQAMSSLSPNDEARWAAIVDLATTLTSQYQLSGDATLLNKAITLLDNAYIQMSNAHTSRLTCISSLANSYHLRYYDARNPSDLDQCIAFFTLLDSHYPSNHPNRSTVLSRLSFSLCDRSQMSNKLEDFKKAVEYARQGYVLTSNGTTSRGSSAYSVSHALLNRSRINPQKGDLEEAAKLAKESLQCAGSNDQEKSLALGHLGLLHSILYSRDHQLADVSEAIKCYSQQAALLQGFGTSPFSPYMKLGVEYLRRYNHNQDRSDLEESITILRKARQLSPKLDPLYGDINSALFDSLQTRFKLTRDPKDSEEAAKCEKEADEASKSPNKHFRAVARG